MLRVRVCEHVDGISWRLLLGCFSFDSFFYRALLFTQFTVSSIIRCDRVAFVHPPPCVLSFSLFLCYSALAGCMRSSDEPIFQRRDWCGDNVDSDGVRLNRFKLLPPSKVVLRMIRIITPRDRLTHTHTHTHIRNPCSFT